MSEIKGRDLNGMQAVAWKEANVSNISSIKVEKNCSQSDLFEAIKKIVSESVKILRADCSDDKYRNIVDLIMLRVRGVLETTIDSIEEMLPDIDNDKIIENVSQTIKKQIAENLKAQHSDLSKFSDVLVQTLEKSFQQKLDDAFAEFNSKIDEEGKTQYKTIIKTEPTANQPSSKDESNSENTSVVRKENAGVKPTTVGISPKSFETLQAAIDKSIVALENSVARLSSISTIKEPKVQKVVKVDLKNLSKLQSKIDSSIVALDKNIEKINASSPSSKPLEQTSTALPKPSAGVVKTSSSANASSGMPKGFKKLFNMQWDRLLNILDKQRTAVESTIQLGTDNACKRLDAIEKKIAAIQKELDKKSGFSILGLILIVSLLVIPFFKDKIKNLLSLGKDWLVEKFTKLFDNPTLKKIVENVKLFAIIAFDTVKQFIVEHVLEKFNSLIADPLGSITNWFKSTYNEFLIFKDTVFGWFSKKQQEADDEKIEVQDETQQVVESNLFDPLNKMTCLVDTDLGSIQKTSNDSVSQMSEAMTGAQTQVTEQVENLQTKTDTAISNTTAELDQESQKISQNVIPGMQQSIEESTNNALEKQQSSLDQAITGVEQNVNQQIVKAEKVVEENGAPTGITTDSLDKLEQEASKDGGTIKTSGDSPMSKPQSIEETTVVEQNKQVALYTKKGETSRAAQENVEVNKFQELYYNNNSASTTNLQVGQGVDPKIENNVTEQIVVDANSPELESKSPSSNVSKAMQQIVQHSSKIETGLLESKKLLNDLKGTMNRYFELLDKGIQDIVSKESDNSNPGSLILLANSGIQNQALMET